MFRRSPLLCLAICSAGCLLTAPEPSEPLQAVKACEPNCDTGVGISAPGKPSITILPNNPTANDNLNCMVTLPSDAGSHTVVYTVQWQKDGTSIDDLTTPIVTADHIEASQAWTCTVTAAIQGFEDQYTTQSDAAEVVIQSSGPKTPTINIQPTSPAATDNVICVVTPHAEAQSTDSYLYEWILNNSSVEHNSPVLSFSQTSSTETWTCRVTAFDAEGAAGTPVLSAEVTIN